VVTLRVKGTTGHGKNAAAADERNNVKYQLEVINYAM
jgi:hypothetical protein